MTLSSPKTDHLFLLMGGNALLSILIKGVRN